MEEGTRGQLLGKAKSFRPNTYHLAYIGARQMAPRRVLEMTEAGSSVITAMRERLWEHSESAVQPKFAGRAALGGAEAVVRREIVAGRTEQLPGVLPDLVYSATVPFLGQEEALRLVRQARALLADTRRV